MNKKFLFAAGAILLTGVGAFAGRISAKKLNPTALYASFGVGAANCRLIASAITTSALTTGGTTGVQATINTVGSATGRHKLYSTLNCNSGSAVRYHG